MEKLIMLGTGNALTTKCYNTCFALQKGQEYLLVDAGGGNGILIQHEKAGIAFAQIHQAILTHAHTDHLLGMVWVCRMIAAQMRAGSYDGDFHLYSHKGACDCLIYILRQTLPKKLTELIDRRIWITPVNDGECVPILGEEITFFDIGSTKIQQFGFYFPTPKGRFICFGDEPCGKDCQGLMKNAYFVLHEAFCLYSQRDTFKPYEKHHSTARDAAMLAQASGAVNLLLYHTEDKNLAQRKSLYTQEAQQYFSGNVFVPEDLEVIPL